MNGHGTFGLVFEQNGNQVLSYFSLRHNKIRMKINEYDNYRGVLYENER
jgi:hypothetical protein